MDTKVANALLGAVTAAALASELASRDASISGLQASKADASALAAYALQSTVDTSSEVDSKIATALLDAVTTAALDAALLSKADASALASLLSTRVGHTAGGRHQNSKCPAGSRHRGPSSQSRDASITALQGAKADATLLASYATNAALSATLQSALDAILAELAALQLSGSGGVVNAPAWAGFTSWELVRGSNVVRNLHFVAPLSAALANGDDTLSITADCYSTAGTGGGRHRRADPGPHDWTARPSSGCSVALATHTAGAVSVDGYTLTLAVNPWNIVRTYNLTPGRELLFACRHRLGTASNFVVYMSEADNVYDPLYGSFVGDRAPGPLPRCTSRRTSRRRACPTRRLERWTSTILDATRETGNGGGHGGLGAAAEARVPRRRGRRRHAGHPGRGAAGAHAHHARQLPGALQQPELCGLGQLRGGRLPAGGLRHDLERLRLEHRAHLHADAGETLLLRLPVQAGHGLQLGDVRQRGRQRLRGRHRHLPRHALARRLEDFSVPPGGVAKLHFGAFGGSIPGLVQQSAGTFLHFFAMRRCLAAASGPGRSVSLTLKW